MPCPHLERYRTDDEWEYRCGLFNCPCNPDNPPCEYFLNQEETKDFKPKEKE